MEISMFNKLNTESAMEMLGEMSLVLAQSAGLFDIYKGEHDALGQIILFISPLEELVGYLKTGV